MTFDDFHDPPALSSFSKQIWVVSVTTDPPFFSPKNQVIPPPKILRSPPGDK